MTRSKGFASGANLYVASIGTRTAGLNGDFAGLGLCRVQHIGRGGPIERLSRSKSCTSGRTVVADYPTASSMPPGGRRSLAASFRLSDLSWPQAAKISRPRGVLTGLA